MSCNWENSRVGGADRSSARCSAADPPVAHPNRRRCSFLPFLRAATAACSCSSLFSGLWFPRPTMPLRTHPRFLPGCTGSKSGPEWNFSTITRPRSVRALPRRKMSQNLQDPPDEGESAVRWDARTGLYGEVLPKLQTFYLIVYVWVIIIEIIMY